MKSYRTGSWRILKKDILRMYDAERALQRYQPSDLQSLALKQAKKPIENKSQWLRYVRRFQEKGGELVNSGKMTERQYATYFWLGIPLLLQQVLESRLRMRKPNRDISEPYPVEEVSEVAESYFHRAHFKTMVPDAGMFGVLRNEEDSGEDSEEEEDTDSELDDLEVWRKTRAHRKLEKRLLERAPAVKIEGVSKTVPKAEVARTTTFQGPQEEVAELISKLNNMQLENPEYGVLYYRAVKLDPDIKECIRRPPANVVQTNITHQSMLSGGGENRPYVPIMRDGRAVQLYPFEGRPSTSRLTCFGCGLIGHRIGDCPEIAGKLRSAEIKRDSNTRQFTLPDGTPIPRGNPGETFLQALTRVQHERSQQRSSPPSKSQAMLLTIPHLVQSYLARQIADRKSATGIEETEDTESEMDNGESSGYDSASDSDEYGPTGVEEGSDDEFEEMENSLTGEGPRVLGVERTKAVTKEVRHKWQAGPKETTHDARTRRIVRPPVNADGTRRNWREQLQPKNKLHVTGPGPLQMTQDKIQPVPLEQPVHESNAFPPLSKSRSIDKHIDPERENRRPPTPKPVTIPVNPKPYDARPNTFRRATSMEPELLRKSAVKDEDGRTVRFSNPEVVKAQTETTVKGKRERKTELARRVSKQQVLDKILGTTVQLPLGDFLGASRELSAVLHDLTKVRLPLSPRKQKVNLERISEHIPARPVSRVNMLETEHGKLIELTMEFRGTPITAILDSGSQVNVISSEVYEDVIQLPVDVSRQTTMNDANGGEGTLREPFRDSSYNVGKSKQPWMRENRISIDERKNGTYLVFKDRQTWKPRFEMLVSAIPVPETMKLDEEREPIMDDLESVMIVKTKSPMRIVIPCRLGGHCQPSVNTVDTEQSNSPESTSREEENVSTIDGDCEPAEIKNEGDSHRGSKDERIKGRPTTNQTPLKTIFYSFVCPQPPAHNPNALMKRMDVAPRSPLSPNREFILESRALVAAPVVRPLTPLNPPDPIRAPLSGTTTLLPESGVLTDPGPVDVIPGLEPNSSFELVRALCHHSANRFGETGHVHIRPIVVASPQGYLLSTNVVPDGNPRLSIVLLNTNVMSTHQQRLTYTYHARGAIEPAAAQAELEAPPRRMDYNVETHQGRIGDGEREDDGTATIWAHIKPAGEDAEMSSGGSSDDSSYPTSDMDIDSSEIEVDQLVTDSKPDSPVVPASTATEDKSATVTVTVPPVPITVAIPPSTNKKLEISESLEMASPVKSSDPEVSITEPQTVHRSPSPVGTLVYPEDNTVPDVPKSPSSSGSSSQPEPPLPPTPPSSAVSSSDSDKAKSDPSKPSELLKITLPSCMDVIPTTRVPPTVRRAFINEGRVYTEATCSIGQLYANIYRHQVGKPNWKMGEIPNIAPHLRTSVFTHSPDGEGLLREMRVVYCQRALKAGQSLYTEMHFQGMSERVEGMVSGSRGPNLETRLRIAKKFEDPQFCREIADHFKFRLTVDRNEPRNDLISSTAVGKASFDHEQWRREHEYLTASVTNVGRWTYLRQELEYMMQELYRYMTFLSELFLFLDADHVFRARFNAYYREASALLRVPHLLGNHILVHEYRVWLIAAREVLAYHRETDLALQVESILKLRYLDNEGLDWLHSHFLIPRLPEFLPGARYMTWSQVTERRETFASSKQNLHYHPLEGAQIHPLLRANLTPTTLAASKAHYPYKPSPLSSSTESVATTATSPVTAATTL
ncbi:hypothetical protein AAF712_003525 [Marasmius tenuissimus]|uniref:CCHC-type domain-containing protein n=1 Tax=Marasmius tenuissimus TaxID=585030 RepID=A0ABR3A7J7_9AGAR